MGWVGVSDARGMLKVLDVAIKMKDPLVFPLDDIAQQVKPHLKKTFTVKRRQSSKVLNQGLCSSQKEKFFLDFSFPPVTFRAKKK